LYDECDPKIPNQCGTESVLDENNTYSVKMKTINLVCTAIKDKHNRTIYRCNEP